MLFSLYGIGAGKPVEALTLGDVSNPEVIDYVRRFNQAVDHYLPDTLTLMSKVYGGPDFGHIYFLPEDDLVKLYQGKLPVTVVSETRPKPLERRMVMVYPREGATAHNHSAAVVQAPWVSADQREAAARWIAYLHEDAQQLELMADGFRPATSLTVADPISPQYGLVTGKPPRIVFPDQIDPQVGEAIVDQWGAVKKAGVAAIVVGTSGSMSGPRIEQARKGVQRFLDGIDPQNWVGFLTFSDGINSRIDMAPVSTSRFHIKSAVDAMRASGQTALYQAIAEGIRMADEAPADANAIRGVLVLTDGAANTGTRLDALVRLRSRDEKRVPQCSGLEQEKACSDESGRLIPKKDLHGDGLAFETTHDVHVFFVGVGEADLEIGRILAEATHGSYKPTTEKSIDTALEQFGKYF